MSKQELEVKERLAREDALAMLEALLTNLRAGSVSLHYGDEHLTLPVGETLELALEAEQKGRKCKLTLELAWKAGEDTPAAPALSITGGSTTASSEDAS